MIDQTVAEGLIYQLEESRFNEAGGQPDAGRHFKGVPECEASLSG